MAVVLGIIAASVPVLLFNAWLRGQGEDETAVTAAWALGYADTQIGEAVTAINDLSTNGIDSCRPAQVEAMRRAVLRSGPFKELLLIGQNGQVACTDSGLQVRQQVIASVAATDRDILLELVRIGEGSERLLRVRKVGQADKPSIAAVIPTALLLPQVSLRGGRLDGAVRLTMPDGAVVSEAGKVNSEQEQRHVRLRSQPYGLTVTVSLPVGGLIADQDALRRIAMLVTGVTAIVILLFALRRARQPASGTAELAKAILSDQFVPYYQPVVDIQTGKLLGAEVLVRWKRADGSFIEPAAFAALIESSGLSLDLTRSLMRRVRDDIGAAIGKRPRVSVAFNVAPQHFDDAMIINDVGTIFDNSQIKLTQIVLELTERHRIDNLTAMRKTIAALQGMGCKVAIDDAGTGHSGLSYILKLGVDIIKIDKVFVHALGSEGHSKATIETLIDLAKNMRMEIVAEGVEDFDQVTYLRERGVAAAQGYVFAPPLPAGSFLQLLDAMEPVAEMVPAPAKPQRASSFR
ncbi:EAL domain-containing protein [Rhodoplanes sp. Z2-YC6860]|uniref:EAL domain-containing protein n=1 Tax=Rhodoplanes sp. Z2-YC6860 TaxID=674703 RepID=UPI0018DD490C|nr:EAL domain-containing protein [Rhodoplanes sp. Z2-YC6860]